MICDVAECLEIGTVDPGETIEQAIANSQEATQLDLEEFTIKLSRSSVD